MQNSADRRRIQQQYSATPHPWMAAAKCAAGLAVLVLLVVIAATGDGSIVPPASVVDQVPTNGS